VWVAPGAMRIPSGALNHPRLLPGPLVERARRPSTRSLPPPSASCSFAPAGALRAGCDRRLMAHSRGSP
jgi:hypothetical protein